MSASFLLSACTSTIDPSELQLPYEEKIVVRGLIEAGLPLSDIQISRTLPPLDTFGLDKVFVSDAQAMVRIDGMSYAMQMQPNSTPNTTTNSLTVRSLYYAPLLTVQSGKTYQLTVQWRGKTATATTRVPAPPTPDNVRLLLNTVPRPDNSSITDTVFTLEATVRGQPNDVYRLGAQLRDSLGIRNVSLRGFGDIVQVPESGGTVVVRSDTWRGTTATTSSLDLVRGRLTLFWVLEVYDGAYYQYFLSRNRGGQTNPFSPGGPNVEWNVEGNGLGMFIGMAQTRRKIEVR